MPSRVYEVVFDGESTHVEYVFSRGVAADEGGKKHRFQELKLLEEIRSRDLRGVYIDGGAHIGNHTLFFAKHCPSTYVVSIEGHPTIYEHLVRNVNRNHVGFPKVRTYNCALWNEAKQAWMGPVVHNNSGRTQLCGDGRRFAKKRDAKVKATQLDWLFPQIEDVAVLKLDIEDCEVQAIQGAKRLLERCHPLIIAEHHDAQFFERFAWEVEPLGYVPEPEKYDPRGETRIWRHSS